MKPAALFKPSAFIIAGILACSTPAATKAQDVPENRAGTKTYARFVPERDDDFAWENDRVAFRAYGPSLQRKAEQHKPGGLITSGIDCWFKRVDYPIINRWYSHMNYHKDTGEGLDCYNVGPSRGCGGTAIYYNGKYHVSENFTDYKILENTPDKVVFQLHYAPVTVGGKTVEEIKTITIESGNNHYRCDVSFITDLKLPILAAGLALHDMKGHISTSSKGWISYWEKIQDAEVGTAVWCNAPDYRKCETDTGKVKNAWLHIALKNNKATYYSGFTWTKAHHHKSEKEWLRYIRKQNRHRSAE